MRWLALFTVPLSLAACGDEDTRACPDIGCIADDGAITLVDDAGNTVAARGEYRVTYLAGGIQRVYFFDCTGQTPETAPEPARCQDGVIALYGASNASAIVELHYEIDADEPVTYTEWERLDLEYTPRSNADTYGPDCSCTWDSPTARSTLVPEAARRPLP